MVTRGLAQGPWPRSGEGDRTVLIKFALTCRAKACGGCSWYAQGQGCIQRKLSGRNELTVNVMKFSQDTCPALCQGQTNIQKETGWDCLAEEQLCGAGTEGLGHTWMDLSQQDPGRDEGWVPWAVSPGTQPANGGSTFSFFLGICLAVFGILDSSLGHSVHEGCEQTAAQQRVPEVAKAKALALWGEAEGVGLIQPGDGIAPGTCCPQDLQRLRLFAEVNSGRIRDSKQKSGWSDFSLILKK